MKIKNPNAHRKHTAFAAFAPARLAAARLLARLAVDWLMDHAPRSTNRYVRGWAVAARGAGLAVAVPTLRPDRHRERLLEVLNRELDGKREELRAVRARLDLWFTRKRRKPGVYGRKLQNRAGKLERDVRKLSDTLIELSGEPSALVFDAARGKRRVSTIRVKVYGGSGRVDSRGAVVLKNLEPHARILESGGGVLPLKGRRGRPGFRGRASPGGAGGWARRAGEYARARFAAAAAARGIGARGLIGGVRGLIGGNA